MVLIQISTSSKGEEADTFTQIGHSYAHSNPVDSYTNSEWHGSPKPIHTTSYRDFHMNPIQVEPEPVQPVVGFR